MAGLLEMSAVTLRFGGLTAVQNVSLSLDAGSINGIIGPNGAGKSTMFNLITGLYAPTSGAITFAGQALARARVDQITRIGIARTFQNIRLFAFMSVRENVLVGYHGRLQSGLFDSLLHTPRHRREERQAQAEVAELLAFTNLDKLADRQAHSLSYGDQRRLEIARALAAKPQLLLLDEPAAGMNPSEKSALLDLFRRIQQRGITILLIEHDMPLVMKACRYVWVLDHGECISAGTPDAVRLDPRVVEAYLGAPEPVPANGEAS